MSAKDIGFVKLCPGKFRWYVLWSFRTKD